MPVADMLRRARKYAGLTQRELAERVGVPQSSIARWESGDVDPAANTFLRVIRACGRAVHTIDIIPLDQGDEDSLDFAMRMTPEARVRTNRQLTAVAAEAARSRREGRVRSLVET